MLVDRHHHLSSGAWNSYPGAFNLPHQSQPHSSRHLFTASWAVPFTSLTPTTRLTSSTWGYPSHPHKRALSQTPSAISTWTCLQFAHQKLNHMIMLDIVPHPLSGHQLCTCSQSRLGWLAALWGLPHPEQQHGSWLAIDPTYTRLSYLLTWYDHVLKDRSG